MEQMLDPDLPAVHAVADHLVQVLMNLLINAADAIQEAKRENGSIRVVTTSQNHFIQLKISDNGTGIPSEILEKIFNEHFTTKPPGRGSGLGLALCRTLINQSGGNIVVSSQVNKMTELTVTLPAPEFSC